MGLPKNNGTGKKAPKMKVATVVTGNPKKAKSGGASAGMNVAPIKANPALRPNGAKSAKLNQTPIKGNTKKK